MDNWEDAFRTAFRGGFSGVLRWPQLDGPLDKQSEKRTIGKAGISTRLVRRPL